MHESQPPVKPTPPARRTQLPPPSTQALGSKFAFMVVPTPYIEATLSELAAPRSALGAGVSDVRLSRWHSSSTWYHLAAQNSLKADTPHPIHPPPHPPPTPSNPHPQAPHISKIGPETIIISCSKGILNGTLETVEELLQRVLPAAAHPRLAFLSGPSFAKEVRRGRRVGRQKQAAAVAAAGRNRSQRKPQPAVAAEAAVDYKDFNWIGSVTGTSSTAAQAPQLPPPTPHHAPPPPALHPPAFNRLRRAFPRW